MIITIASFNLFTIASSGRLGCGSWPRVHSQRFRFSFPGDEGELVVPLLLVLVAGPGLKNFN